MGFFDMFSSKGGDRTARQIAKAAKKLGDQHVQTAERKRCISVLEGIGTHDAIRGILNRFTYRTPVQIVDEDEKELSYEALLALGEKAVEPIREFVREEMALYWPLRVLSKVAGEDDTVALLIEEIDGITEGYDRDVARKHELVSNLREFETDTVYDKLVELLRDETEEVRILAIDGLTIFEGREPVDEFMALLAVEEETGRVKQMILDMLIQGRMNVKRYKKELADKLPPQYWVDDTGMVQRK